MLSIISKLSIGSSEANLPTYLTPHHKLLVICTYKINKSNRKTDRAVLMLPEIANFSAGQPSTQG